MSDESYRTSSRSVATRIIAATHRYAVANGAADDDALSRAMKKLEAGFGRWADLPAAAQRTVPLQMIREALEPLGVSGPMTSRDLGEEVFAAHVEWGIARAREIAGVVPTQVASSQRSPGVLVAVVSGNLLDRERIVGAVRSRDAVPVVWRNPADVEAGLAEQPPQLALVDLEHTAALDIVSVLVEAGIRTVGFGPHVDDHLLAAVRSLGADEVLPRSVFFRRLAALLPTPI